MRFLCILLSVAGVISGVALLQLHSGQVAEDGLIAKVCQASEGGCEEVLSTKWAWFPPDLRKEKGKAAEKAVSDTGEKSPGRAVPTALLGLAYFTGFLVWFLLIGKSVRWMNSIVVLVGFFGCAGSMVFLFIMYGVLEAVCPFCLATHVINFLLFGTFCFYFLSKKEVQPKPVSLYGAAALAALAIGTAEIMAWRSFTLEARNVALEETLDSFQKDIASVELIWRSKEPVEISVRDDAASLGPDDFDPMLNALPGYRNTVVMFGDAECPACARFHRFLFEEVRPLYNGHLRIVWKHLPFSEIHPSAWEAARALEAARLQGKFWTFLEKLHEKQDKLEEVDYPHLAATCGMNPDRFELDRHSVVVQNRIESDVRLAERLGIDSTPAVFLNSRRVDGSIRNLPGFWKQQALRLRSLREQKDQGWGPEALAQGSRR